MSTRPRSLRELARLTGLSVPGVLRHLDALAKVGVVRENSISSKRIPVRKTYSLKGVTVVDFSFGDLSITEIAKTREIKDRGRETNLVLLASEVLMNRRRLHERARRFARTIDDYLESESRLVSVIESMDLEPDERFIVMTAFTEDTMDDAERILESEGVLDARRSIEGALAKAKRIVRK
jgi:hypothetical protein